jgi:hypothetical protein
MAMVDRQAPSEWAEPAVVQPHTYPLWVVGAAALVVVAALYSFSHLQLLVDATGSLRAGQKALAARDYSSATVQLETAHEDFPSSRKATIYLATAEFGLGNNQAALGLIGGMKFTRSEWATLTQTMPTSIQALYHETN